MKKKTQEVVGRKENVEHSETMERSVRHTPGPWTVAYSSGNIEAGKRAICRMFAINWGAEITGRKTGFPSLEAEANARLIAAAPELLAACIRAARLLAKGGDDAERCAVNGTLMCALEKAGRLPIALEGRE